jgi:hypothetical protein
MSGEQPKKKRKRQDAGNEEDNSAQTPKRTQRLPLQGKLFAVTTLVEASTDESPEGYSQLIELCKKCGAKTTGQVHKRVDAVIAAQSAVKGGTQRVRKAWKKGIPVVDPSWIRECLNQGKALEMGPYTQGPLKVDSAARKKAPSSKSGDPKGGDKSGKDGESVLEKEDEGLSVTIDLGCCCLCHDTTSGRTDCAWCIDCSVNRAFADVASSS